MELLIDDDKGGLKYAQRSYAPLPEDIYTQIEQIALETKRNITKVLLDTISSRFPAYPENPDRLLMKREIAAYKTIHAELAQKYLGQYVAVYHGELVDYDPDPVALHKRVIAKYPDQVVLSRKVQEDPNLYFSSPKDCPVDNRTYK